MGAVLVTGGGGFIGAHLVRRLLADGAERVIVVDQPDVAHDRDPRVSVLPLILGTDAPAPLLAAMAGVETVVHCAAQKHHVTDTVAMLRTNILGTQDVLAAATQAGVRRVVFLSSLYVYGRLHGAQPFTEDLSPAPTTPYGLSKLCGELLCQRAAIPTTILRLFFVYGPDDPQRLYRSVLYAHIGRLRRGLSPVIHGDGQQTFDYVHVDDVMDAIRRAQYADLPAGTTVNIGTGHGTRIVDLTTHLLRMSGTDCVPVHDAPDWTAGSYRVADRRRADALLGWAPQVSWNQGLARLWRWFDSRG